MRNYNLVQCSAIVLFFLFLIAACKDNSNATASTEFSNELKNETSPYLLQHANNPVNWKAWNSDLFNPTSNQDKLVIISIGYSSCHWCHVMERETFEDKEVAQLMNENFISIKVDREERPDVDEVYQRAIQLVNHSGGWPLNVIALPNGKPLYLGTYSPKDDWLKVLTKVNGMYTENPEEAHKYADRLSKGIQELNLFQPAAESDSLRNETLAEGLAKWNTKWDLEYGGDQVREKFMTPNTLTFLLDYAILNKDDKTLKHLKNSLDKIAAGGIFDQLGGGFYRYSTDPYWKVPHFEKMLYDNAQALSLYSKAYAHFGDASYKEIVYATNAFLEREMKNAEGGYYAALNAESDGVEGKFYTWTKEELQSVLAEDYALFSDYYSISEENIWEEHKYVLHKSQADQTFANQHKLSLNDLHRLRTTWHEKLLETRAKRVRPSIDDKILTSWNAMLLKGFADAYASFGDALFLNQATHLFEVLRSNSYSNNYLLHSFKTGSKISEGFLEDYAFLIEASLALYKVTQELDYLDFSRDLTQIVLEDFSDEASGLFTFSKNQELISKIIKTNDGDIASPNSVMAHNLFQLGHIDYNKEYLDKSKSMLSTLVPMISEYTDAYANWANLLLHNTYPYFEIVIVGDEAKELRSGLQAKYIPNSLIIASSHESKLPLFKDRYNAEETLIYVCQNSTCKLPVNTIEAALKQMRKF